MRATSVLLVKTALSCLSSKSVGCCTYNKHYTDVLVKTCKEKGKLKAAHRKIGNFMLFKTCLFTPLAGFSLCTGQAGIRFRRSRKFTEPAAQMARIQDSCS